MKNHGKTLRVIVTTTTILKKKQYIDTVGLASSYLDHKPTFSRPAHLNWKLHPHSSQTILPGDADISAAITFGGTWVNMR